MKPLVCDICGGRLMGKAGSIFECENCGMQYDKLWAQEKIQEIKGTVQIEGTVDVTGSTIRVDNANEELEQITVSPLLNDEKVIDDTKSFLFHNKINKCDVKKSELPVR